MHGRVFLIDLALCRFLGPSHRMFPGPRCLQRRGPRCARSGARLVIAY